MEEEINQIKQSINELATKYGIRYNNFPDCIHCGLKAVISNLMKYHGFYFAYRPKEIRCLFFFSFNQIPVAEKDYLIDLKIHAGY